MQDKPYISLHEVDLLLMKLIDQVILIFKFLIILIHDCLKLLSMLFLPLPTHQLLFLVLLDEVTVVVIERGQLFELALQLKDFLLVEKDHLLVLFIDVYQLHRVSVLLCLYNIL